MNIPKKITQRVLDAAKLGWRVYWMRDTLLPGFSVKLTPTGHKTFNLDYIHRPFTKNRRWKLGDAGWMKAENNSMPMKMTAGAIQPAI